MVHLTVWQRFTCLMGVAILSSVGDWALAALVYDVVHGMPFRTLAQHEQMGRQF